MAPIPIREARAFENMTTAIDMMEMFERISIRNHKSFLVHGAVFKHQGYKRHSPCRRHLVLLSIGIRVVYRVAERRDEASGESSSAAKNPTTREGGEARIRPLPPGVQGPAQRVHTKGFPTNNGHITHQKKEKSPCATQKLRSGDGLSTLATMPASRRTHRLMDDGRTKQRRTAVKLEHLTGPGLHSADRFVPIKAFVRLA